MPAIHIGDCVSVPDGRIGRVRAISNGSFLIRLRRTTSDTHEFLTFKAGQLTQVEYPKGWMSPEGYLRYLRITLAKMRQRQASSHRSK